MIRKASAIWRGTAKEGKGHFTTTSGVLDQTPYTFRTRFDDQPGTNPEELVAAAHAGCIAMALALQLQQQGYHPNELKVEAAVTLEKEGDGFSITQSALTLEAQVPGIEREVFEKLAYSAKSGCPISKLLKTEILLNWALVT